MNQQELDNILNQIVENSKFKNVTPEQKQTLKQKLIKKYSNDFNQAAFEMMDSEQKKEFSNILASQNQEDIDSYIGHNISNLDLVTEKASEKFINEVYLLLKE